MNDDTYSGETMCNIPYRNKIFGHLFTREDELQAEIDKLNKRIDFLEKMQRLQTKREIHNMQTMLDLQTNYWSAMNTNTLNAWRGF